MGIRIFGLLFEFFDSICSKLNEKERIRLEQLKTEVGLFEKNLEIQNELNKIEAQHQSIWVAGWRPSIGWVCSAAMAWQFLGLPMAKVYVAIYHPEHLEHLNYTNLDESMFEIVFAMLGLGGMRTYEKYKGISKNG